MEIGIAGWALNRSILREKTLTLLDFPALVRDEFGVDTVELVSTFFESQNARYLNQLRDALGKARLRVHSIAVDTGNLASPDEAIRRTDLETIKQWCHVARALGSAAIRVNTGDARPDDREALERIVAGYEELAAEAGANRVKLLIENHGGASADPANIAYILDRLDTPWFATCPDTGNFAGDTWEAGMRVMAPRAFSAHVKVFGYDPSGLQVRTAPDGTIRRHDLKRSLAILRAAGYAGPLNFESNSAETDERAGIRKGIAYVKELLATLG